MWKFHVALRKVNKCWSLLPRAPGQSDRLLTCHRSNSFQTSEWKQVYNCQTSKGIALVLTSPCINHDFVFMFRNGCLVIRFIIRYSLLRFWLVLKEWNISYLFHKLTFSMLTSLVLGRAEDGPVVIKAYLDWKEFSSAVSMENCFSSSH